MGAGLKLFFSSQIPYIWLTRFFPLDFFITENKSPWLQFKKEKEKVTRKPSYSITNKPERLERSQRAAGECSDPKSKVEVGALWQSLDDGRVQSSTRGGRCPVRTTRPVGSAPGPRTDLHPTTCVRASFNLFQQPVSQAPGGALRRVTHDPLLPVVGNSHSPGSGGATVRDQSRRLRVRPQLPDPAEVESPQP